MRHRRAIRAVWRHLAVVALLAAAVSSTLAVYMNSQRSADNRQRIADVKRLGAQNKARISDIQRDRVTECVQTYEGIRDVFRPFFQPKSNRAPADQRNIDRFNKRIEQLEAACPRQVDLPPQEGTP